jgi:asparagine synthase (glutamine-hydrolysing)
LFNASYLNRLVQEHSTGAADHTERLWALVNFEMWQRHFLDGEALAGALPQANEVRRSA